MRNLNFRFKLLQKYSTYPLYIIILSVGVFFLPFVYFDSLIHKSILAKHIFVALISISSFSTWLLYKHQSRSHQFSYNNLYSFLLLFFLFSASSILWSQFEGSYQLEIIHFASLLLLVFVAMQIKNIKFFQLLLFSAVSGAAFTALIAFIQAWGWNPFYYNTPGFPAASFINKNHLANYIDLLIPASLFLLATLNNDKKKWIISISISLLFSYLIVSHNRASWISLLVIFSLILYLSYKHSWLQNQLQSIDSKYISLITLISIVLIVSPVSTKNEENRFAKLYASLENTEITTSASQRLNAYKGAIEIIKDNPILGTGLGSFQIAFKPYNQNITRKGQANSIFIQLHNDPLQIFVELGIIGGLLATIFVFMIIYKSYQTISNHTLSSTNTLHLITLLGILLSIIASVIHSLLDFPLHLPASSFLLFLYVGLLMSINAKTKIIKLNLKVLFVILTVILLFFTFSFYKTFASASYHLNDAVKTLFSYHPKVQYQPLLKQNSKNSCEVAKFKTDKALNIYSNDFHLQAWAYVIYVQCVKNQTEYLNLAYKILADNPYHSASLQSAALISYNNKNYLSSKHYYQVLHYLEPLKGKYTLLLGHTSIKEKDYINAQNFYLQTLALDPGNIVATEMLNKLSKKGLLED